jgi:TolA-binding protein
LAFSGAVSPPRAQLRNNVTQLSTQIVDLQGRLAEAQRANEELQQINGSLQQQLQQQARRVAILTNPDQSITLAATDPLMAANGNFYRLGEEAVLVLRGLEPLPEGQTYQLWLLPPGGGASIPADLIEVADSSTQTVTVAVAPEYTNLTGVGVSIEPAGGSLEPTTIVLLGTEPVPSA